MPTRTPDELRATRKRRAKTSRDRLLARGYSLTDLHASYRQNTASGWQYQTTNPTGGRAG